MSRKTPRYTKSASRAVRDEIDPLLKQLAALARGRASQAVEVERDSARSTATYAAAQMQIVRGAAERAKPSPARLNERSTIPCRECGERHLLQAFPVGSRVLADVAGELMTGDVIEWGQYNGPLWCRVEFDKRDQHGDPVRANFAPCELKREVSP